jgi:hypothetical protein
MPTSEAKFGFDFQVCRGSRHSIAVDRRISGFGASDVPSRRIRRSESRFRDFGPSHALDAENDAGFDE